MAADSYSFLDIAALPAVRGPFSRGDALLLLSVGLDEVLWANGSGASLFGFPGIDELMDAPAPIGNTARRQIAATRGFPQIGTNRSVSVRLLAGGSRAVPFRASSVALPDGADGILLALPHGDRAGAPERALAGIAQPGQAAAIVGNDGAILAASTEFGAFGLPQELLRKLVAKADETPDQPLKQKVQAGDRVLPAGVAVLEGGASLVILTEDDFFELPDDVLSADDIEQAQADSGEAAGLLSDAASDDDDRSGVEVLLDDADDWYFETPDEPETPAPDTPEARLAAVQAGPPVRFSWRTDPQGRFVSVSPEFSVFAGPSAETLVGRSFGEACERLGIARGEEVAQLLTGRDTWSGRTVLWPIADGSIQVPVDLAALPTYSRARSFDGFRGFGVVRTADAFAAPAGDADEDQPHETQARDALPTSAGLPSADPAPPHVPSLKEESDRVVQLLVPARAPAAETVLSPDEQDAFLAIGAQLKSGEDEGGDGFRDETHSGTATETLSVPNTTGADSVSAGAKAEQLPHDADVLNAEGFGSSPSDEVQADDTSSAPEADVLAQEGDDVASSAEVQTDEDASTTAHADAPTPDNGLGKPHGEAEVSQDASAFGATALAVETADRTSSYRQEQPASGFDEDVAWQSGGSLLAVSDAEERGEPDVATSSTGMDSVAEAVVLADADHAGQAAAPFHPGGDEESSRQRLDAGIGAAGDDPLPRKIDEAGAREEVEGGAASQDYAAYARDSNSTSEETGENRGQPEEHSPELILLPVAGDSPSKTVEEPGQSEKTQAETASASSRTEDAALAPGTLEDVATASPGEGTGGQQTDAPDPASTNDDTTVVLPLAGTSSESVWAQERQDADGASRDVVGGADHQSGDDPPGPAEAESEVAAGEAFVASVESEASTGQKLGSADAAGLADSKVLQSSELESEDGADEPAGADAASHFAQAEIEAAEGEGERPLLLPDAIGSDTESAEPDHAEGSGETFAFGQWPQSDNRAAGQFYAVTEHEPAEGEAERVDDAAEAEPSAEELIPPSKERDRQAMTFPASSHESAKFQLPQAAEAGDGVSVEQVKAAPEEKTEAAALEPVEATAAEHAGGVQEAAPLGVLGTVARPEGADDDVDRADDGMEAQLQLYTPYDDFDQPVEPNGASFGIQAHEGDDGAAVQIAAVAEQAFGESEATRSDATADARTSAEVVVAPTPDEDRQATTFFEASQVDAGLSARQSAESSYTVSAGQLESDPKEQIGAVSNEQVDDVTEEQTHELVEAAAVEQAEAEAPQAVEPAEEEQVGAAKAEQTEAGTVQEVAVRGALGAAAQPGVVAAGQDQPDDGLPHQSQQDTSILDRLPMPVLIHSGDVLHYANPEFLSLAGYASLHAFDEAGGLGCLFTAPWERIGDRADRQLRLRTGGGDEFPVEALLRAVPWGEAKALLLVLRRLETMPVRDTAEAAMLGQRLTEMRAIIDTATDGVVLCMPDGTIRSLSRPAEALFGLDSAAAAGLPFGALFAAESQRIVADYLRGLAGDGLASVLNDGREVIGREAKGGFIPLFMTVGSLPEGSGFCAVLRDITQWKRAEEELVQSRALAERASSHKTDFLARVSHEIRTPLNAIIGFSELMLNEKFGPVGSDRYRDYLRDINRSGSHVLDLVNDLLDISKIEAGQQEMSYEAVALNDALGEAVATMQPQANRERVIIRSSFASRLPDVVADSRSVRQIALNVLSNAIRFTQAGGQVIVSTAHSSSGDVVMRVRDTGIGMSQAEIEQALKPFKQINSLKRSRGDGTGLGLPLTKAMVEANRARFAISSDPGVGTMVEVTFPSTRVLAG